jgi:hypothetical protein
MQEWYVFNLNAMFVVNLKHEAYYMLCFHGRAFRNKVIVDFNCLAILFHILSTTVGEICAHAFLIHGHSTSFIMRCCSLTEQSQVHPFVLMSEDNTSHTMHFGMLSL